MAVRDDYLILSGEKIAAEDGIGFPSSRSTDCANINPLQPLRSLPPYACNFARVAARLLL